MALDILLFPSRRARAPRPDALASAVNDQRVNVLVLGGSPHSLQIAEALATRADIHVVTSVVGREEGVGAPAEGDVRIGGFSDAQALADFVRERRIALLIDAADPFAPDIRRHAAETALRTGVTRLVFESAAAEEQDDDDVWIRVRDCAEAADLLPGFAARAMLDVTRPELDTFARLADTWFLLRGAEKTGDSVPLTSFERLTAPLGASVEQEQAILRQHQVEMIVTREPLCEARARLFEAARAEHVPVMVLDRPPLPPSEVLSEVDEVLAWVEARLARLADGSRG